ncbi:intracellular multiplication protein IcmK [Rhodoblastus sphagnicola]|uniref:DotH/IcmK family type IV secretion protein n=1 Tax=Rhodoblastus sphagnicola TaxID=333368 RepID=UPI00184589E0|nr:DotH/IcmK family type IV secretion protein [Rhodoblastus sphagnicola]MBB4200217.1 intracellular multiplication protein IcmK [Rhodoblastus sphagnicola]
MCVVALAVLSSSVTAFAQQNGVAGGGGRQGKEEESIPLNPDIIREIGKRVGETRRAQEEVNTQRAAPQATRVNVGFAPGETTPIVRLVKGYPTAISFFDDTGQPWPIEWNTNSNPAGGGGSTCSETPAGGGGPGVASVGFYVCTPTVGSNVLQISPASIEPRGGLVVNLKNAPKPLSFLLVGGGGVYDADLTVHVSKRGPNARGPVTGPSAPDTASPFLTAMLQGVPPADAVPLNVSGVSPDDFRAWKIGDRVVIRTIYQLVSPEWFASEAAEGNVTVYSLPATPVVLLSKNGATVSASLSEP